jgi:hypothetical protein
MAAIDDGQLSDVATPDDLKHDNWIITKLQLHVLQREERCIKYGMPL